MKKLKIKQKSNCIGFTLVELVIVIAIVIILSVISVPIYRGYVDKAKMAEGYALLGTILSAQKAYYSQYGNFFSPNSDETCNDTVLGIDARGNKYFTLFRGGRNPFDELSTYYFNAKALRDGLDNENTCLILMYNITRGAKIDTTFDNKWYK